jgi:DNA-binding transcriptional regulator YiaG
VVEFRNLAIAPGQPVGEWATEGVLSALERGSLNEWRRLADAVRAEPYSAVAGEILEAIEITESRGVAAAMRQVVNDACLTESECVARRVRDSILRSGMTQAAFAAKIGTSQSRLSTYAAGKVTPSAVVMARIERVASSPVQIRATPG